jgi:hypothetical protein
MRTEYRWWKSGPEWDTSSMHFAEKENIVLDVSLVVGSQARRIVARKLAAEKVLAFSHRPLGAGLAAC